MLNHIDHNQSMNGRQATPFLGMQYRFHSVSCKPNTPMLVEPNISSIDSWWNDTSTEVLKQLSNLSIYSENTRNSTEQGT